MHNVVKHILNYKLTQIKYSEISLVNTHVKQSGKEKDQDGLGTSSAWTMADHQTTDVLESKFHKAKARMT